MAELTSTVAVALVPEQDPPHPVNANPSFGVAVSVTVVGSAYTTWHVVPAVPHVNPPPVTVPPVGAGVTVNFGTTGPILPPRSVPVMSWVHKLLNDAAVATSQPGAWALAARRGLNEPVSLSAVTDVMTEASDTGVPSPPISKPTSCSVLPCVTRKNVIAGGLYATEFASYAPTVADSRRVVPVTVPASSRKFPKGRKALVAGSV